MTQPTPDYPERSNKEIIRLGFAGRCPRCGRGRIFDRGLKVAERCRVCGLGFAEHDSGDGAVVPAMLLLGTVLAGMALWVELAHEPPLWMHFILWGPIGVIATLLLLKRLKGIGIALQHKHRSTEIATKPGAS